MVLNDILLKILVCVSKGCNSVFKSFLMEEGLIILFVLCLFNINNFFYVFFFKILILLLVFLLISNYFIDLYFFK